MGSKFYSGFECEEVREVVLKENRFPDFYNNKLLNVNETLSNSPNHDKCVFDNLKDCSINNKLSTIVPINGNRERLGTLLLARFDKEFTDEDLILAEYSATIIGLEILRSKQDQIEEEARKKL